MRRGMGANVIHFFRLLNVTWAKGALGAWLPPVDETVVAFRPLPWELDGRGGLTTAACRRMLDLACRNWVANSGLVAVRPARWPSAADADEFRFDGPIAALQKVEMVTRFVVEGGEGGHFQHQLRSTEGRIIAVAASRPAFVPQGEWAAV
jgi:hypothetical protein